MQVSSEPSHDYLTAYAEKEVRERLQRATPPADRYIVTAPAEPAGTTQIVQKWVSACVPVLLLTSPVSQLGALLRNTLYFSLKPRA